MEVILLRGHKKSQSQSQTTLHLTAPCNSAKGGVERGRSGGGRSPMADIPCPAGSSIRPCGCGASPRGSLPAAWHGRGLPAHQFWKRLPPGLAAASRHTCAGRPGRVPAPTHETSPRLLPTPGHRRGSPLGVLGFPH